MSIILREKIKNDIFDYLQLTDALSSYSNVRGKIGRLLANREIIRIKKGFYTFPEYLRCAPLNSCMLANMLYGPSYVSTDYALSYYGLIPERVEVITSMTKGRTRIFSTPPLVILNIFSVILKIIPLAYFVKKVQRVIF